MKVLFFCNLVPARTGAVERLLTEVGRVFQGRGDQLVLGLPAEPGDEVASAWRGAGLTWNLVPGWTDAAGREHPWRFCGPALKWLKRHRPDVAVVHFGNEGPSFVVALLAKAAGLVRVRWVWVQDQQIADPTTVTRGLSRIRLLALVFDHFVAVYEGGKRSLLLRGIPEHRISVIRNAVADYESRRPRGWLRQELGAAPTGISSRWSPV